MNIETVNELIASLESAGELSIKERKYLELAKEFRICSASLDGAIKTGNVLADQNSQLAAENVALKDCVANHAPAVDHWNAWADQEDKIKHAPETPATDRIVAEAEARGVEKAIAHLEKKFSNIGVQIMNLQWLADSLREGADK